MEIMKLVTEILGTLVVAGGEPPQPLHEYSQRNWYSDRLTGGATRSADGQFLAYENEGALIVHDLELSKSQRLRDLAEFENIGIHCWLPEGNRIEIKGTRQGQLQRGVFDLDQASLESSPLPRNLLRPCFSADGQTRAGVDFRNGPAALWVDDLITEESWKVETSAAPFSFALSPDGDRIAWVILEASGWGTLWVQSLDSGEATRVAQKLDIGYQRTPILFSPWGDEVLLSLVQIEGAQLEDRHAPESGRDLDLYAKNLETGEWRKLVDESWDLLLTAVDEDQLVYTRLKTDMRAAMAPLTGGEPQPIAAPQTCYPYWHPDGTQLSMMWGEWNLADWALNWDIAAIKIDSDGAVRHGLTPLLQGYHEDFNLAWSPDGRWMAYHSHRSPDPVTSYAAPGSTDAIWLRASAGGPEIPLTGAGHFETCQAEWASDGRELIFCSIGRDRPYRPFVIRIDPDSGASLSVTPLETPEIEGAIVGANFSPTRNELFLEQDTGSAGRRLWRMDRATQTAEPLVDYQSLVQFGGLDVTPDGNTVVYFGLDPDGHHQAFAISREGGTPRQITRGTREFITPQVSPDGKFVAGSSYTHSKEVVLVPFE